MEEGKTPDRSTERGSSYPQKIKGRGLLGSSGIVSTFTMISRILGLLRDVVLARVIGAEALADVFFVAFKIPNFLRRLFSEGAFSQAFIPVLGEYRERGGQSLVRELVSRVFGNLGLILFVVSLSVVLFSPVVTAIFAPSWYLDSPEKFSATAAMLRITFPYLFFISLTGFAAGILNTYDRFAVPAFTPMLLNLTLISAAIIAAPWFEEPTFALAWGVLCAGAIQFVFQLPFLARIHMLPMPVIDWQHSGVRKILALMAPAIFGVSVSQVNLLLDTVLATFLPSGSVSWLYYSDRLAQLPLGVFGVAIATVILPNLSRYHALQSSDSYSLTLDWAIKTVLLLAVPSAAALILLAHPILTTLFFYGDVMTVRDMQMSAFSLRAYALGLVGFMLIKVLAPGFFARQDMTSPVRFGIIAMGANMLMNLLFVVPLHYWTNIGHVGLALATSLAAYINAALLLFGLRRDGILKKFDAPSSFFVRLSGALVFMIVAVYILATFVGAMDISIWHSYEWWQRLLRLCMVCFFGILVYVLALFSLGFSLRDFRGPELREFE